MGAEGFAVADGIGCEEAAAQYLGYVFLEHRLDALLPLAAEDAVQLLGDLSAECIALVRIGGQQRGDNGAAVNLRRGLGQALEEVLQAMAPDDVLAGLGARPHQHLVHQHQGG